ncbi:hypothetical protein FRC12_021012 [Ceratobasidium sp. 428]|nr:hypothetical protein FRC12_021012 [Ceratobasidium sp. 428]
MPCIKVQLCFGAQRRLQSLQPPVGNRNPSHPGATGPNRAPLARFPCPYCTAWMETWGGRTRHIIATPACTAAQARDVENARVARDEAQRLGIALPLRIGYSLDEALDAFGLHGYEQIPFIRTDAPADPPADGATAPSGANADDETMANANDSPTSGPPTPPRAPSPAAAPPPAGEDVAEPDVDRWGSGGGEDGRDHGECGKPVVEAFSDPRAGQPINDSCAEPFDLHAHMKSVGRFASPADFEVAELLMTTKMTNAARDTHLKSRKYRGKTPWPNAASLMKGIDKLPRGPDWKATVLGVGEGEEEDIFVVYLRDVIDVLRELIGNPRFKRHMRYAPEKHWTLEGREKRVYGETWTGDWWWKMQVSQGTTRKTDADLPEFRSF